MRKLVLQIPKYKKCSSVRYEDVQKLVPKQLSDLIGSKVYGDSYVESERKPEQENVILSICQDVIYNTNRMRLTPKHVGLGLIIHQMTRSEETGQLDP